MAKKEIQVESLKHNEAKRRNIPTAELESVMEEAAKSPVRIAYERRNRDLDPQLVWRGKDEQDWSDLVVPAPPLYIQEKVQPKVIIDDLIRRSKERKKESPGAPVDLFADFNGLKDREAATEFYQHDQHWSNRMISGDSLSVMASLAEREGLRGKVQCIYFDPPYGIKFNSNFQWSTTSRDVKDGAKDHITREPEQVRAFRDTWRDGIHSYLTYLRDRLTVARDLLHESGSIFVQIGDENVHRVRAVMDEVFGDENFVSQITFKKSSSATESYLSSTSDFLVWFGKKKDRLKFRPIKNTRVAGGDGGEAYRLHEFLPGHWRTLATEELAKASNNTDQFRIFRLQILTSQRQGRDTSEAGAMSFSVEFGGANFRPSRGRGWTTTREGIERLAKANRIGRSGETINYKRYFSDAPSYPIYNIWDDTQSGSGMEKTYVVQTNTKVIERCILMTTDPGDLVLDPTCGSGTTAYVAEHWGRRWITIDTSRVSLALARSRLMGARYPYYMLADSPEGQRKEGEVTRTPPKTTPTRADIRQGFVYERVPHITLKSVANNAEIDVIWEKWQDSLEELRATINSLAGRAWQEWQIPHDLAQLKANTQTQITVRRDVSDPNNPIVIGDALVVAHRTWWELRIARQKEIDASIAAKAEFEYLYDKPYADAARIRVAGPFTVESLSPHRTLAADWNDELIDIANAAEGRRKAADPDAGAQDFAQMILENLKTAGVQQAHKEDRIAFTSLTGWPGHYICAEGRFIEGETEAAPGKEKRAGIFIGPEFGTVSRADLVAAAKEAAENGFDILIACAFSYDAHSAELERLGRIQILKARMNPDLHMAADLKATGAGNLFVVFGEPDIRIQDAGGGEITVKIEGVDVFKPQTGEVISEGPDGIALWMIDTDYNEESFFVRHAYFLGANDPYKALKTTLKAEIDEEAWQSLYSDTSRPFPKPATRRIAVKVINHLGDEVMKVFSVG